MPFLVLICVFAAAPPLAARADEDRALLREHKISVDGPSLVNFLRKRYAGTTDEKVRKLIAQLGDDDFETREEATQQLILIGVRASSFLKAALRHEDLEVRHRAQRCLTDIEKGAPVSLQVTAAAIRELGRTRPEGAVAVLLDCVASAEDAATAAEMQGALARVGVWNGKADPTLVKALEDPLAKKRLAAALALLEADAEVPAVRKRLNDPHLQVRLQVGMSLLQRGERGPLRVLAEAMGETRTREIGLAEDVLLRLAGEKSPTLKEDSPRAVRAYRDAWVKWVQDHGARANLDVLKEQSRLAGFTTVLLLDDNEVLDLDASNRVRWRITGLQMPLDVQRLAGEHVLLAEHGGDRVTERDRTGKVVWQYRIDAPLMAQRLPNGNTFICCKDRLLEVDRKGREAWSYVRPLNDQFMRARRLPGGDTIMITQLGVSRFVRIDRFGKEVSSFGVEVYTSGGRIDLTPTGNVLVPELHNNRVVEYSMDGTQVRSLSVEQPITAFVLPNGNLIVTSMTQRRAYEIDRSGKEVWEYKRDTRVTRAVRY